MGGVVGEGEYDFAGGDPGVLPVRYDFTLAVADGVFRAHEIVAVDGEQRG